MMIIPPITAEVIEKPMKIDAWNFGRKIKMLLWRTTIPTTTTTTNKKEIKRKENNNNNNDNKNSNKKNSYSDYLCLNFRDIFHTDSLQPELNAQMQHDIVNILLHLHAWVSASTIVTALILNVVIGFKLIAYNIYISVTCTNKVNENNKKIWTGDGVGYAEICL